VSKQMAAWMEALNVMERLRLLPFIVMFVVAAEFWIFSENPGNTSCDHDSNPWETQEFDDIEEKWPQCIRRLGHYFSAFVITEEDKNSAMRFSLCV